MNKNLIIVVAISVIVLVGGAFLLTKQGGKQSVTPIAVEISAPDHLQYFWGDGCPHCAKVQEFFDGWDKKDQVNVEKLETWFNKDNATKMQAVGDFCKIPKDQLGVPLLFTPEGKCLIGDTPIIDYFKNMSFDK